MSFLNKSLCSNDLQMTYLHDEGKRSLVEHSVDKETHN